MPLQFNEQTNEGLKKAISDLTSQLGADKIKGFVIDLRNNPGGLLDQAISVSDALGQVARPGIEALGLLDIAAARGDDLALVQERVAGALQEAMGTLSAHWESP